MNKDLNFRFFYYRTRAAYEFDKANGDMPDGAIIFIEEANSIITHGHEFGPSTHYTIDPEQLNEIIDAVKEYLTALWGNQIDAVNNATQISIGMSDDISDIKDLIDGINNRLSGIDTTVGNLDNGASVLLAAKTYTDEKIVPLSNKDNELASLINDLRNSLNDIEDSIGSSIGGSVDDKIATATLGIIDDISAIQSSINSYETKQDANDKLAESKQYTDLKIAELGNASGLQTLINTANSKIDIANGRIDAIESQIEDINGSISNINNTLSDLTGSLEDTVNNKVDTAVQEKVDDIIENLPDSNGILQSAKDYTDTKLSGINNSISTINGRVNAVEEQINEISQIPLVDENAVKNAIINDNTFKLYIVNDAIQQCSYTAGTGILINNNRVISVNIGDLINSLTPAQIAQLKELLEIGSGSDEPIVDPQDDIYATYLVNNTALEAENVDAPQDNTFTVPGSLSSVTDKTVNLVDEKIN